MDSTSDPAATGDETGLAPEGFDATLEKFGIGPRVRLTVAACVCFALMWFAGSALSIPSERGFDASLLHLDSPIAAFLTAIVLIPVCVLIGALIVGAVHLEGGLFAAALGLAAWSVRGGPMRYTLFAASSQSVFLSLAVELMLLYGVIVLGRLVLLPLIRMGWLADEEIDPDSKDQDSLPRRLMALGTQVAVTGAVLLFLAHSDAKNQALIGVFIAAFLGSFCARGLDPNVRSHWFWMGPLIVGVVGYVVAYFYPQGWTTGNLSGTFAALARPLPLDYASTGPAGALLGYWAGQSWSQQDE